MGSKVQFTPRFTKPKGDNKYYIRKASGGWNAGIKGKPTETECDVLANCVSYVVGRFNEESNEGSCKYLAPVNPPIMPEYADGCDTGTEAKLGAVIIWQKGETTNGHCGIVEAIQNDGSIITSESHYGGSAFDLNVRTKGTDGTFFFKDGYHFVCFIYNPNLIEQKIVNEECEMLKATIKNNNNRISSLEEELAKTKENLEIQNENVYLLNNEVDAMQVNVDDLKNDNKDKNNRIQGLTNVIDMQDKKIEKYKQEIITQKALRGDVNGDGKIDISDAIYLFLHCIKPTKYIIKGD